MDRSVFPPSLWKERCTSSSYGSSSNKSSCASDDTMGVEDDPVQSDQRFRMSWVPSVLSPTVLQPIDDETLQEFPSSVRKHPTPPACFSHSASSTHPDQNTAVSGKAKRRTHSQSLGLFLSHPLSPPLSGSSSSSNPFSAHLSFLPFMADTDRPPCHVLPTSPTTTIPTVDERDGESSCGSDVLCADFLPAVDPNECSDSNSSNSSLSLEESEAPPLSPSASDLWSPWMETSTWEKFVPDISVDGDNESFVYQFSGPGRYLCTLTGLSFHMAARGQVVYRTVTWSHRLLGQYHKKPAGPLFDITCEAQSVVQLHLLHNELLETDVDNFLSVAHVTDDDITFFKPHDITPTHCGIGITSLSCYGLVKEEDCPLVPVRALVLLFYRPPGNLDRWANINVLLLPRNIVMKDLMKSRREENGQTEETQLTVPPHCNLVPGQNYLLLTKPKTSVEVQPSEADFDEENHDSYFSSFQVTLKKPLRQIKLKLKEQQNSGCVWDRNVCLPCAAEESQKGHENMQPNQIRAKLVQRISEGTLVSLVDSLLDTRVISHSEKETIQAERTASDKARCLFDLVRNKGQEAYQLMIERFRDLDPYLYKDLSTKLGSH